MSFKMFVLLVLVELVSASVEKSGHFDQPICSGQPWTVEVNGVCKCGDNLNGVVQCDSNTLETSMLTCYCMTYSDIFNRTVVGSCIYSCDFLDYQYIGTGTVKNNESIDYGCTRHDMQRMGQMCGKCQPGYAPAVYSYILACVECKNYKYNWLLYVAIAFLPLTLVYFVIVFLRINATSATMNTYVLACQLIAAPTQLRLMNISALDRLSSISFGVFSSLYMIWNLDVFRALYTPFCLHPNTTTLQILALEYVVAVYPFALIIVSYILVHLHYRYSVIVRLWSPVYRVFAYFRREWDIHSSLIGAFATFILLSYVKIANVSFDILTPVILHDPNGNAMQDMYLYYDGTIKYFGKDHLPYALLALLMLLVFNVAPLVLLCLYPCRCFQQCLNHCNIQSNTLRVFMDTFQGCYRTEPHDCRYFAAIYVGFRLVNFMLFSLTTSPLYYALMGSLGLFTTVLVAILRPYKQQKYIITDVAFLTLLSFIGLGLPSFAFTRLLDPVHVHSKWYRYPYVFIVIPPLYGFGLFVSMFLPKRALQKLKQVLKHCFSHKRGRTNEEEEEPLPYRIEHNNERAPLLNVKRHT